MDILDYSLSEKELKEIFNKLEEYKKSLMVKLEDLVI